MADMSSSAVPLLFVVDSQKRPVMMTSMSFSDLAGSTRRGFARQTLSGNLGYIQVSHPTAGKAGLEAL